LGFKTFVWKLDRSAILGLERLRCQRVFTNALKQCKETTKDYEGSEESLKYILQGEEKLKRIVAELN